MRADRKNPTSMIPARCIAYRLMAETRVTLVLIGKLNGMSEQEVEACGKDQALLDKIAADQRYALETLKVESTRLFSSMANGSRARCHSRNWKRS